MPAKVINNKRKSLKAMGYVIAALAFVCIGIVGSLAYKAYSDNHNSRNIKYVANCSKPYVKGNINADGEKIYHLPWDSDYNRTEIDKSKGEIMFCSEHDAQIFGWKHTNAPPLNSTTGGCQAEEACWKAVNGISN